MENEKVAFVDSLELLRQSVANKWHSEFDADRRLILFADANIGVHCDDVCRWRDRKRQAFTIGSLWLFVSSAGGEDGQHSKYTMKEAQNRGFGFVSVLEKQPILEFISLGTKNVGRYDNTVPLTKAHILDPSIEVHPSVSLEHLRCPLSDADGELQQAYSRWLAAIDQGATTTTAFDAHPNRRDLLGSKRRQLMPSNVRISPLAALARSQLLPPTAATARMDTSPSSPSDMWSGATGRCSTHLDVCFDLGSKIIPLVSRTYFHHAKTRRKLKQNTRHASSSGVRQHHLTADAKRAGANPSNSTTMPVSQRTSKACLLTKILSMKLRPILVLPSISAFNSKTPLQTSRFTHISMLPFAAWRSFFLEKRFPSTICDETATDEQSFIWRIPRNDRGIPRSSDAAAADGVRVCEDESDLEFIVMPSSAVRRFSKYQWCATVAVFLHGAEWQFRNWPFDDFSSLFSCIKGVFIAFEDESLPTVVTRWPIDVLRLRRDSRHVDSSVWYTLVRNLESCLSAPRDFNKFNRALLNKVSGGVNTAQQKRPTILGWS